MSKHKRTYSSIIYNKYHENIISMSYYGHDNRVVEIYVTALQLSEDYSILLTNMLIYFMLNTNLAYIRILNSFDIYLSCPKNLNPPQNVKIPLILYQMHLDQQV